MVLEGDVTQEKDARPLGANWAWTLASGLFTLALAGVAFLLPVIEWVPRGGLVGWLLFLAGIAELAFGWVRGLDAAGKAAVGSGLLTALAGLLFVLNPLAGYFTVTDVVLAWLLIRGAWMLVMALGARSERVAAWLALTGAADLLLGFALMVGVQAAIFVVTVFGPTPEIVAQFALILAASFLVTGISQIAIAVLQRASLDVADEPEEA